MEALNTESNSEDEMDDVPVPTETRLHEGENLYIFIPDISRAADPHDPKIWDAQNVFGLSLSIGKL